MNLKDELKMREYELTKVLKDCENKLKKAPKGYLKVRNNNGKSYYYLRCEGNNATVKYINKKDFDLAKNLAQRDYELAVRSSVKQELKAIDNYLNNLPPQSYEKTFDKQNIARQKLITPHYIPDNVFLENWQNVVYEKYNPKEKPEEHYTNRGELVKSKSEVLIANALNEAGIPYRYEYPLRLGGITYHPDFTILRMSDRKVLYWEHLGLLDSPGYISSNMSKFDTYEANGIFLGTHMIVTRETKERPLNIKHVWATIHHYFD